MIYLIYESRKGYKDVIAATTDKEKALKIAQRMQYTLNQLVDEIGIPKANFNVYEIEEL